MNERIKELTEHAGFKYSDQLQYWTELKIELFAELIRADEREACAKVCEKMYEENTNAWGCAAAIRARSKHEV
jgi:hypothetical protein